MWLAVGLTLLFLAGGIALERLTRDAVWGALDASLDAEARRLGAALRTEIDAEHRSGFVLLGAEVLRELDASGPQVEERRRRLRELAERHLRVRLADAPVASPTETAEPLHRIDIRTDDGQVVARSPRPDGRHIRKRSLRIDSVPFENEAWQRSWTELRARLDIPAIAATVRVASDAEEQHALLAGLRTALLLCGALLVAAAAALAVFVTRRGLAPLRALRRQVERLSASTLERGVELERPVAELAPIVQALDGALRDLDRAFAREKRMTEDLAHELRTPVAELKSITDVAQQWPDDEELQARCVTQCHGIAERMTRLVAVLLRVARARSAEQAVRTESLDVRERLVAAWSMLESTAAAREQQLDAPEDAAVVLTDPDVLDAILANLLQNAIEHAPTGSRIAARLETDAGGTTLALTNPAGDLAPDDAERAMEPFWRGDEARTSSRQGGLGLSLVAELARAAALEFGVGVEEGRFTARLRFASQAAPQ